EAKTVKIDRISVTTPRISFLCDLQVISLRSVVQSVKTLRSGISSSTALERAYRTTSYEGSIFVDQR
ncbi:unnamed protein product, partial [Brassica rapa subsp. trilocularis]